MAENNEKNGYRKLHAVKTITFSGEEIDLFEKTYNQTKKAIENHDITLLPLSTNGFEKYELELAPRGKKAKIMRIFLKKIQQKLVL